MENHTLKLTKKFIAIPSETGNADAISQLLQLIKDELKDFACSEFVSHAIPSLLFSNSDQKQRNFKILLNAHVDVVPGQSEQYQPFIIDGKLYGRGANDMKSAAAAMVIVFKEIAKEITYPLGLQIVTDEEAGGENGTNYQLTQGVRADFVIGGEHANMHINNEAKGVYYIKLQANGTATHAAYPWQGKNASVIMMQAIHILHELLPIPEKEAWVSTASVIKIETDTNTVNTTPHTCTAYINIRSIPEEKRDLIKELRLLLPQEVSLEILLVSPSEYTPVDNPFVLALKQSIKEISGKPAEFLKTHGQSDLRYYHMIGIPAVNFGPLGGNHHAKGEWVDIESLDEYSRVIKNFLFIDLYS